MDVTMFLGMTKTEATEVVKLLVWKHRDTKGLEYIHAYRVSIW
jgi:hypothetical protein